MKAILSIIFSITVISCHQVLAQNSQIIHFNWNIVKEYDPNIQIDRKLLGFEQADYNALEGFKPTFIERIDAQTGLRPVVSIEIVKSRVVNNAEDAVPYLSFLTDDYSQNVNFGTERGKRVYFLNLVPIRKKGGLLEVAEEIKITYRWEKVETSGITVNKRSGKIDSKLAKGKWISVDVSSTGIYKLDLNFFNKHNIDVSGVDVNKIAVFGYGGEELPMLNSAYRPEDMKEIPSKSVGLSDGKFDNGDYILFYAQGPITWSLNTKKTQFKHDKHTYADKITYMICLGEYKRTEVPNAPKITGNANVVTDEYNYLYVHHKDQLTDISKNVKTGKEWFGEEFNFNTNQNFDVGTINGLITSDSIMVKSMVAGRNFTSNSTFTVRLNGKKVFDQICSKTDPDYLKPYVVLSTKTGEVLTNSNHLVMNYEYDKPSSVAVGWLNYFEIHAKSKLVYSGGALPFRNKDILGNSESIVQFNINAGNAQLMVWNVSDINNIQNMQTDKVGSTTSIKSYGDKVDEYIAFTPADAMEPEFNNYVANQNLHGLAAANVFIVAYDSFVSAARELAKFHAEKEGFTANIVTPKQIYNEFSSGTQDISAIRDFIRYFYENATSDAEKPKYLILFGDASYDFKDRIIGNTNLVPSYQSNNSIDPTGSYVSDDYYGLLDPAEGDWEGTAPQLLDIAIGRLPVQTTKQAYQMIAKTKAYYDSRSLGDWRNNILFVADDQDSNLHLEQTEEIANSVNDNYPLFNLKKIYFDAFVQVTGPGGAAYPDVSARLNETIESGILVVNYMGHGGELGWAHERVLDNSMINSWTNLYKLPLFVTATCEFSRFDDPERTSAGEHVYLNPQGGAIAMLTTTRVVYAGANAALLKRLYTDNIFSPIDDRYRTLGEIIMTTKNKYGLTTNTRNFTLLGDPVVRLDYPKYRVQTTGINGAVVDSNLKDTFQALSKMVITGIVTDVHGNKLTDFNGVVYPTVFDKVDTLRTLANDPDSKKAKFGLRKNILYKGKATVTNGDFKFEFVVPKDISYKLGYGKISYYADNGSDDANGDYFNFVIGGTADDIVSDNTGPDAALYINDLNFSFGGISNEDPLILGVVSDDNGINTVGTGIGHELTLVLDNGEPIVVNDYYEAALDDYRRGTISYPVKNLSEGRHSVSLKVWDVANNSATAYTEFVVANSAKLALDHVLNYPNPFTSSTTFWINHNRPGDMLDVTIQIFSIGGKLVKTLNSSQISNGSTINTITWDGTDDYGQNIGKGVYVYRVSVKTSDGLKADAIEKLVLLK